MRFREFLFALPVLFAGGVLAADDAIRLRLHDHYVSSAAFAPQGNAFSAAIRVKPEYAARRDRRQRLLMSAGNGYSHGFRLCLRPDTVKGTFSPFIEIGVGPGTPAWSLMAPPGSVLPGRWSRVAATWDGKTVKLYVEGREVASAPHSGAYVPAPGNCVRTGAPGEGYGIASIPHLIDSAAVWTRALSPAEVSAFAPGRPFEPDTPGFADLFARISRGAEVPLADLDRWSRTAHSPNASLAIDRARVFSYLAAGNAMAAERLKADVLSRMEREPGEKADVSDFRNRYVEAQLVHGFAAEACATIRSEYEAAKASHAGHLPYVALRYMKILIRAGHPSEAAKVRRELLKMDLRRFPHLASELGLAAEFTAHPEKGASVSRRMPTHILHVAPDGDDSADGSAERPFRTPNRARDAVRALKRAEGLPAGGVAVRFRGGVYRMEETWSLADEDSGEPDKPVVWCAASGERPVFDGGFTVPRLRRPTDAAALARIPAAARGHVLAADLRAAGYRDPGPMPQYGYYVGGDFRAEVLPPAVEELYQDGEWLQPARYPNEGWLRIVEPDGGVDSNACVRTAIADLSAWAREPDLAATGFWNNFWADLTTPVKGVDARAGTLSPDFRIRGRGSVRPRVGQTFFLLNALCALDAPGEWYVDRASGVLYVWPRGDRANARFALAGFGETFLRAENVHDVRFEGLVFRRGRGTGIVLSGCRDCIFIGNAVTEFGGMGLDAPGCRDMTVKGNIFRTFGHGAMAISGGERKTLAHSGNVVSNNEFADVEHRRRTYAPHLHLAGVGIEVSHNHFHDSPSSAMRLEGNDMYIVSNLVENVLLESDDQGGVDIYFNASYFGNRYCWNTWKNIGRHTATIPCGQAGVRFDGNISGQTVYGNRFINCGTGGFGAIQSCGGRLHVIDNNLFVDCNKGMSISIYPTNYWFTTIRESLIGPCLRDVVITNAPFATRYPGIADLLWTNQVNHLVRNITVGETPLLVNPPSETVAYGNLHFEKVPDLAKLARETAWRPIPEESETGPRQTKAFLRAKANDRPD